MRVIPSGCEAAHPQRSREVVGDALRYFSDHFREAIAMQEVAEAIGISEECLDFCFDQSRGMTPFQALHHHRLNRLFQRISEQPGQQLAQAIRQCGLPSTTHTLLAFEEAFGIGMPLFRRTCRRAREDREFRLQHPRREQLVLAAC